MTFDMREKSEARFETVNSQPGSPVSSSNSPKSCDLNTSTMTAASVIPGTNMHFPTMTSAPTLVRPTATAWPNVLTSQPTSSPLGLSYVNAPKPLTPPHPPPAFFMNPQCYAPLLQHLQSQQRPAAPMGLFVPTSDAPHPPQAYYNMLRSPFAAMGMLNPALVMPFGLMPHQMHGGLLPPHLAHLPPGFQSPEEPKPPHSYIGLIAMAILSSPEKKLVLSDIYQWILDHYPYFRTRGPGWRNSIRHNLSLNDCFVKAGRSANGKGHYWAIHPANVSDFQRGDFRRRKAQRKVRLHMGLEPPGPEDEDDDDDVALAATTAFMRHHAGGFVHPGPHAMDPATAAAAAMAAAAAYGANSLRKRTFDVASLLAPDTPSQPIEPPTKRYRQDEHAENPGVVGDEEEIDVLSSGEPADADGESNDGENDMKAGVDVPAENASPESVNDADDVKQGLRQNFDLAAFYADYARARLAAAALNPVNVPEEMKHKNPLWISAPSFFPFNPTSEPSETPKKPLRFLNPEELQKEAK